MSLIPKGELKNYIFEMLFDKMYIRLEPVKSTSKTVKRDDGSEVELELPEKHHEDTRIAAVLAVGPEAAKVGFDAGDIVVVTFAVGAILHFPADNITDDTHRIVTVREILCKLHEPEKKRLVEV